MSPAVWGAVVQGTTESLWVVFPPLGRHSGVMAFTSFMVAMASDLPSAPRTTVEGLIEAGDELPPFHLASPPW